MVFTILYVYIGVINKLDIDSKNPVGLTLSEFTLSSDLIGLAFWSDAGILLCTGEFPLMIGVYPPALFCLSPISFSKLSITLRNSFFSDESAPI